MVGLGFNMRPKAETNQPPKRASVAEGVSGGYGPKRSIFCDAASVLDFVFRSRHVAPLWIVLMVLETPAEHLKFGLQPLPSARRQLA
jgi:hypothetical protein